MAATSRSDPPTLPCKLCKRKFHTVQAVGAHQKAHRIEHAIAQRKCCLSQLLRARPVGMCACCMETSPIGNRITSTIQQAYFLRLQNLAMMRRRRRQQQQVRASNIVPSNAALASTSCSHRASSTIPSNVAAAGAPSASCNRYETEIIDLETMSESATASRVELDLISMIR